MLKLIHCCAIWDQKLFLIIIYKYLKCKLTKSLKYKGLFENVLNILLKYHIHHLECKLGIVKLYVYVKLYMYNYR